MRYLIYRDGKLSNCAKNKAILGYWKSLYHFYSYKDCFKDLCSVFSDIKDAINLVLQFIICVVLFPILPFIWCYYGVKHAKRLVSKELKEEFDRLHK